MQPMSDGAALNNRFPGPPNQSFDAAPAAARVAVHAVALRALLSEAPSVLSPAEQQLLNDWLDRLAIARSHATGGH